MTRQWNGHDQPTQFSQWLRLQASLASNTGYVATNIDYMWENYKTGQWMIIEEKRYNAEIRYAQLKSFEKLHRAIVHPLYMGFFILRFENTSPTDGAIYLNNNLITEEQLISWLAFQVIYPSYF